MFLSFQRYLTRMREARDKAAGSGQMTAVFPWCLQAPKNRNCCLETENKPITLFNSWTEKRKRQEIYLWRDVTAYNLNARVFWKQSHIVTSLTLVFWTGRETQREQVSSQVSEVDFPARNSLN